MVWYKRGHWLTRQLIMAIIASNDGIITRSDTRLYVKYLNLHTSANPAITKLEWITVKHRNTF